MMKRFDEILQIVCSFLNESNMQYVVVGGVAVMYHGIPRTTEDIDLIIQFEEDEVEKFSSHLETQEFDVSNTILHEALKENSHCTIFVNDSLLRLDIQGVNSRFDYLTLQRAITVKHLGIEMKLGSLEDTIINKVLFGGEQDVRDALGIFVRNSEKFDFEYIEKTCEMLGIVDQWNAFKMKAQKEIDESKIQ